MLGNHSIPHKDATMSARATDLVFGQARQNALSVCDRFAKEIIADIEADPMRAGEPFFPGYAVVLASDDEDPSGLMIYWEANVEDMICDRNLFPFYTWTYPGYFGVETEGDLPRFFAGEIWKKVSSEAAEAAAREIAAAIAPPQAFADSHTS